MTLSDDAAAEIAIEGIAALIAACAAVRAVHRNIRFAAVVRVAVAVGPTGKTGAGTGGVLAGDVVAEVVSVFGAIIAARAAIADIRREIETGISAERAASVTRNAAESAEANGSAAVDGWADIATCAAVVGIAVGHDFTAIEILAVAISVPRPTAVNLAHAVLTAR